MGPVCLQSSRLGVDCYMCFVIVSDKRGNFKLPGRHGFKIIDKSKYFFADLAYTVFLTLGTCQLTKKWTKMTQKYVTRVVRSQSSTNTGRKQFWHLYLWQNVNTFPAINTLCHWSTKIQSRSNWAGASFSWFMTPLKQNTIWYFS